MSAIGAKQTLGRLGSNDRFWRKADIEALGAAHQKTAAGVDF
jgi:hypothetical protein